MTEKVLVVDDERDIVEVVEYNLRRAGFRVSTSLDGKAALDTARRERPDLILLDLMLPDLSGTEVLRILRSEPATKTIPIIFMTARGEEIDRILGFELGADDYVTKPFSVRELVLRVRAVLRRGAADGADGTGELEEVLSAGPIEVDTRQHEVRITGRPVDLTVTEFKLLSDLVRARGRVRSREVLLAEVWGYDSEVMSRTVDTHVRRLREKLGSAAAWLRTIRGVGYRVQDPHGE